MRSVYKILQERELKGTDNKKLKAWVKQKTDDNIRQDKQISAKKEFNIIVASARCNKFVATLSDYNASHLLLSLFNINASKQLWSCPVTIPDHFSNAWSELNVSDSGLVLILTKEKEKIYEPQHIQIFLNKVKTGEFTVTNLFDSSIRIINNRIFGFTNHAARQFFEWNTQGKIVKQIPMKNLSKTRGFYVAASNDYYLVGCTSRGCMDYLSAFIFDLHNNQSSAIDLFKDKKYKYNYVSEFEQTEIDHFEIDSITLLNNKLIVATHALEKHQFDEVYPTVSIIDIKTMKTLDEIGQMGNGSKGKIKNLIANHGYIVFIHDTSDDFNRKLSVKCIDLKNENTISELKSFTYHVKHFARINMDLTDSLLTICYRHTSETEKRCVIDLPTNEILYTTKYHSDGMRVENSSFSHGIFMTSTSAENGSETIYTENFKGLKMLKDREVEIDNEKNKNNSARRKW